jgi:hypothetical protein
MAARRCKGVYDADGRSNAVDLGRHSLATRDRDEALARVKKLDLKKAVDYGKAEKSTPDESNLPLTLELGRALHEEYTRRPPVLNGPKAAMRKRYRAVLDNFVAFAKSVGVRYWNQVNKAVPERIVMESLGHRDRR